MAQVSVDTLNREGIVLVVDIEDMLPWKDHIQISVVSVRTIAFRIRGGIHYFLYRPGRFIPAHCVPQNLAGLPAHHCYNINVFPVFCPWFVLQKPIQFIQFNNFCTLY